MRDGSCLLVIGQWPRKVDERWADRVGVLDVARRPLVLFDGWVLRESTPELLAGLGTGAPGGWDVMAATRWRWAWGGEPLSLWSTRGRAVRVLGPGRAVVRTLGFERELRVQSVRTWVSRGWLMRAVGLGVSAGRTVWVARRSEIWPLLDVTYDGLSLLADVGWASALGKRLADALRVPFETNDPRLG